MTVKEIISFVNATLYTVHANDCCYSNEQMHNFVNYLDSEVEYASTDDKQGLQIYIKME